MEMKVYETWIFNIAWSYRCVGKAKGKSNWDKLQDWNLSNASTYKTQSLQSVITVQLLFRRVFFFFLTNRDGVAHECADTIECSTYLVSLIWERASATFFLILWVTWDGAWRGHGLHSNYWCYLLCISIEHCFMYSVKISPCAKYIPCIYPDRECLNYFYFYWQTRFRR